LAGGDDALGPILRLWLTAFLSQKFLVRIGPFETVDLTKAKPHGMIFPALLLHRSLRVTERHIDLPHLDAVLAGIADDLRRGIKAHRLRIQQSTAERIRMPIFEP
jgi:hypothetical protein